MGDGGGDTRGAKAVVSWEPDALTQPPLPGQVPVSLWDVAVGS